MSNEWFDKFVYALSLGKSATCIQFIDEIGSINRANKERWTALHYAANEGNAEVVEYILTKRAAVDTSMVQLL